MLDLFLKIVIFRCAQIKLVGAPKKERGEKKKGGGFEDFIYHALPDNIKPSSLVLSSMCVCVNLGTCRGRQSTA